MTDAPERIWADFVKWVKISGVYEQNGTWFGAAGRGTEYIRADLVDAQDAAWAERVAALEAAVAAARAEERAVWVSAIETYFDATAVMDVENYAARIRTEASK